MIVHCEECSVRRKKMVAKLRNALPLCTRSCDTATRESPTIDYCTVLLAR